MKNKTCKHLLFLLCFVLSSVLSYSQLPWKYAFGMNAGTYIYQGDLTPSAIGSFKTPGFVLGLDGSRRLSSVLDARLDLNFGQVKADEAKYNSPAYRQQRAFAFKSSVTEFIASAVYHPLGTERKLSPYLFGGIGISLLNIKRDYSRFNAEYFESEPSVISGLNEDLSHRLPKTIPIMPLGVGLQYLLTEKVVLHTEASYRIMSTDYLDGFSQAVNPALKDHYYNYAIGL